MRADDLTAEVERCFGACRSFDRATVLDAQPDAGVDDRSSGEARELVDLVDRVLLGPVGNVTVACQLA